MEISRVWTAKSWWDLKSKREAMAMTVIKRNFEWESIIKEANINQSPRLCIQKVNWGSLIVEKLETRLRANETIQLLNLLINHK